MSDSYLIEPFYFNNTNQKHNILTDQQHNIIKEETEYILISVYIDKLIIRR